MSIAREEDHVDNKGNAHAEEMAEDQANEKWRGALVQVDTAKAHNDALGRPGQENGADLVADHPDGGDGQSYGVEWPPGKTVLQESQHGHN